MKIKGIIAIVVLLCVTAACGIAATYSKTEQVGNKPFGFQQTVGSINFVVSGTENRASEVTVNLYNGTNVIDSYVSCYNLNNGMIVVHDGNNAAVGLGGATSAQIVRYPGIENYEYHYYAHRWNTTSTSLANSTNLVDSAFYGAVQQ